MHWLDASRSRQTLDELDDHLLRDSSRAARPHVLALDDDPSVRSLVRDYLVENELRVTAVATGAEFMAVMGAKPSIWWCSICACRAKTACRSRAACARPRRCRS